jgi:hypothetical protein
MDEARFADQVGSLCTLSLRRLPRMLDPRTGLFVFRVDGPALLPAGISPAYSAMTLIGLREAEQRGLPCPIDRGRVYRALEQARPGLDNSGHLGLVLWAAASEDRALAEKAVGDLLAFGRLTRVRRGEAFHSTELAWVVLGLLEALDRDVGPERAVRAKLEGALAVLRRGRGRAGLFGYARSTTAATPLTWVRSRLGFFDAQVYAILAFLRASEVLGDVEAQTTALETGRTVLRLQGPQGQWPWHYDIERGSVVDLYPVYAVHQDGMAPMALLRLERATGLLARPAVAKGLQWLYGDNELGAHLVDTDRATIWRSIRRRSGWKSVLYGLKVARLAGWGAEGLSRVCAKPGQLEIDREFRPYHLGWLLYGLSSVVAEQREALGRRRGGRPDLAQLPAAPEA